MGNKSSRTRRFSLFDDHRGHDYTSTPHRPCCTPRHHHAPAAYPYAPPTPQPHRRLDRRFSRIADNYHTLDQVIRPFQIKKKINVSILFQVNSSQFPCLAQFWIFRSVTKKVVNRFVFAIFVSGYRCSFPVGPGIFKSYCRNRFHKEQ